MKRVALLSIYRGLRQGLPEFAKTLLELDFSLIASGGTAEFLRGLDLPVQDIAEIVGPAMWDHLVVTLSRPIHAGILMPDAGVHQLEALGVPKIDLVHVIMYPLEDAMKAPDATLASVIDSTDIGGPCMLRSAAKGEGRMPLGTIEGRTELLDWLRNGEPYRDWYLNELAIRIEDQVGDYCKLSARARRKFGPPKTA